MRKTDLQTQRGTAPSLLQEGLAFLEAAPPTHVHGDILGSSTASGVEPYFDSQTVVTRDSQDQPLSRYRDRVWDLSSMNMDGMHTSCNLYFFEAQALSVSPEASRPELAALIREQQKALLWLHIDTGRQRASRTTVTSNNTLTRLAQGAYQRGVTLFDLFCEPEMLGEESAELNSNYAQSARALLRTLWRHRDFLKIRVEVHQKRLSETIRRSAPSKETKNQTPIIPSRIYCAILGSLLDSLDVLERDLDTLLDAYRQERAATLYAPENLSPGKLSMHRNIQLEEVHKVMRTKGCGHASLRGFIAGELSFVQLKLMNLVIAFTGMRIGEARILPLKGVLEEVDYGGALHYVLNGYTHKLNGGRKKPASWVTSREGYRAILLAKRISSTVLDVLKNYIPGTDDDAFLFCTLDNPYKKAGAPPIYKRLNDQLIPSICPIVTQADIDELNAMELERNWLREGIKVGNPWPLTFHQYRRSLSVYAHRSGMVSLPALKGQLQHITDEMRAYYSDGFCRAVNLVFDKDHFSHEWTAAKAESSFLAYSMALLFSDEDLIGQVSGRGAARMAKTVSSRSRQETLKLFRDGKLAYRETVLGGCTAVEGCDHTPLEPIPWDCVEKDCPNAVVFGKRLGMLIKTQETVVATLAKEDQGSVEHRLEVDHLRVLLKARQKFLEAE